MADRTTRFQLLLLAIVAIAIVALVVLLRDAAESEKSPGAVAPTAPSTQGESPVAAYIRFATGLSDSLHDEAEAFLNDWTAKPDTLGLAEAALAFDMRVRGALDQLPRGAAVIPEEDLDLLTSLFLDYLDGPALLQEEPAFRTQLVRGYLDNLDEARLEIEGRLMRHLGSF